MSKDDPFAFKERGDVARDKGKLRTALKFYQKATRMRPQYAAAHYEQGAILVRLGKVVEGANAFALAWMHSCFQGTSGLACGRALTHAGFSLDVSGF